VAISGTLSRAAESAYLHIRKTLDAHPIASAVLVGLAVAIWLIFQANRRPDEMFPRIHDEHAYLIQARMLARGHLWLKPYPPAVAPFFDTFYVFVEPVYASMYFPGTALAEVPVIWLGLPYWVSPVLCAAAAAGFFYSIAAEMFDGAMALLATLLLVGRPIFGEVALMLVSEMPTLLALLITIWAWLRWRKKRDLRWAALIGAAVGWGLITRPLDAVSFTLPVLFAMAIEYRALPRTLILSAGAMALAAAPFVSMQITADVGITGKWYESPESLYISRNFPGPAIGFGPYDLNHLPRGMSPAKRDFLRENIELYETHTLKQELRGWYAHRFTELRYTALPSTLLVIFIPLAFVGMTDIRRRVVVGVLVLFMAGYTACVFRQYLYLVPIMPALILVVWMGWDALHVTWPRQPRIHILIALTALGLGIWSFPDISGDFSSLPSNSEQLKRINTDTAALKAPSLVLFRYDPWQIPVSCFPVFNEDVAWPDDAGVVRANDLGDAQNKTLYEYYARFQPNLRVYRYLREWTNDSHPMQYLGTCRELASRHP
jgi:hypothetical protein